MPVSTAPQSIADAVALVLASFATKLRQTIDQFTLDLYTDIITESRITVDEFLYAARALYRQRQVALPAADEFLSVIWQARKRERDDAAQRAGRSTRLMLPSGEPQQLEYIDPAKIVTFATDRVHRLQAGRGEAPTMFEHEDDAQDRHANVLGVLEDCACGRTFRSRKLSLAYLEWIERHSPKYAVAMATEHPRGRVPDVCGHCTRVIINAMATHAGMNLMPQEPEPAGAEFV